MTLIQSFTNLDYADLSVYRMIEGLSSENYGSASMGLETVYKLIRGKLKDDPDFPNITKELVDAFSFDVGPKEPDEDDEDYEDELKEEMEWFLKWRNGLK